MKLLPIITLAAAATLPLGAVASAQPRPVADPHAAHNPATKSPDRMTHAPLAPGRTSFTREQARARLEKAGYARVANLVKDRDGLWQARALHRGHWVNVALDYKGNVGSR